MNINSTFYIYGLECPVDKKIKYVGLSMCPHKRLNCHFSSPTNFEMKEWLSNLKSESLKPVVKILQKTNYFKGTELEVYWINKLEEAGVQLFNVKQNNARAKRLGFNDFGRYLSSLIEKSNKLKTDLKLK